jgi:hypothetical protein
LIDSEALPASNYAVEQTAGSHSLAPWLLTAPFGA